MSTPLAPFAERLALERGEHDEPHRLLGAHPCEGGAVVRAFHPEAVSCDVLLADGRRVPMSRDGDGGVFAALVRDATLPLAYKLLMRFKDGATWERDDPYRFLPTFGSLDEHLWREGTHRRPWQCLGARFLALDGVEGAAFSAWAPAARAVSVIGDFCTWDARLLPMRRVGVSGIFELFVPGVREGDHYKLLVKGADGVDRLKADPMASFAERPPGSASRTFRSRHDWQDAAWMESRAQRDVLREPVSIYEVHLGSWARVPEEGDRPLTYRELAPRLADHCVALGFTHVELMPVMEHPFDPSWGYQVSGYYAPTSRFGTPDDFRFLVDHLHRHGIGVILDWVPGHFVKDEWALARFDGTGLYEHDDPRRGEHPDWGTAIFNLGRTEVRSFLVGNALFWLREMHADGLRVDAVASMLYLDYSRKEGEWIPNAHGGREDLDAVSFLRELNEAVRAEAPGCFTIAEESTAWPGVTAPAAHGGLGFTLKWNMGWMHDTLRYFGTDPLFRKERHDDLTFAMLYEHSERFVNALSHDEVVHGKGSLLRRMPGDEWRRLANLRCLLAYQWTRPGKKHSFMGTELAPWDEWSHDRSLPWHVLDQWDRRAFMAFVAELGRVYRATPALWRSDPDAWGFEWIDCGERDASVFAFQRRDHESHAVVVMNLTPVPRLGWRIGAPVSGHYEVALDSDEGRWGGSGHSRPDVVSTEPVAWQGRESSFLLDLPPLAVLVLRPCAGPHGSGPRRLREAAERAGVLSEYHDVGGRRHETSDATRESFLRALGVPEDATPDEVARRLGPEPAPAADASPAATCVAPAERLGGAGPGAWGACANLYSVRSARSWGIGDATDLATLAEWVASHGGDFVGLNPLHVTRNAGTDISPYAPLSRLFRNPVYLDVEAVPELRDDDAARELVASPAFVADLERVRAAGLVDYERVAALKDRVLRLLHATFARRHATADTERGRDWRAFVESGGEVLRAYATFRVLESVRGRPWQDWPEELRDPASPEVRAFADWHANEVAYHAWLQFELDRQLGVAAARGRAAGLRIGLYFDLAVGSWGDGFDTWMFPGSFARGVTAGAPPDPLGPEGQDWGFPPFDPWGLARDGFRAWRLLVRANLAHAGALRIDHVLGLQRLFWIPAGRKASAGAYVRQPVAALLDVVAQESGRAGALVIGEDLGTVPEGLAGTLERWGVLSTRVLWFERDGLAFRPAAAWSPRCLATASTHDLPTLRGWREGRDLEIRRELGLIEREADLVAARAERRRDAALLMERLREAGCLGTDDPSPAALARAVHAFLGATPAPLAGLQLDDLAGESEPVNVPGVGPDRFPAWRRRMRLALEELDADPYVRDVMADGAARGRRSGRKRG